MCGYVDIGMLEDTAAQFNKVCKFDNLPNILQCIMISPNLVDHSVLSTLQYM